MERERALRERVYRAFCAPRESFATNDEWNDYLEQREDIAFNLVEGIDQAETEERLRRVEVENADTIAANRAKEVEMEDAARPKASAMQIAEEEPELPEMAGNRAQRQKQLATLASGWSMELVKKRAIQEAFDCLVVPVMF
ncbi:putative CDK-activating kinase assembly factor MAT1 [Chloropicon roscoffensis]|uniref:CDK-activating kinase assembly factor MAT1 n=1 Tax=Chloropicon roscoffensis TaxID=1461544 RepID=A0AAX4PA21_9CHLO